MSDTTGLFDQWLGTILGWDPRQYTINFLHWICSFINIFVFLFRHHPRVRRTGTATSTDNSNTSFIILFLSLLYTLTLCLSSPARPADDNRHP